MARRVFCRREPEQLSHSPSFSFLNLQFGGARTYVSNGAHWFIIGGF
jgi:hypothetical protein